MIEKIRHYFYNVFAGKRIAILGFGLEGRSTFELIRKVLPDVHIRICDRNAGLPNSGKLKLPGSNTSLYLGTNYLSGLVDADIIMKSPGIPFMELNGIAADKIKTQTALFLELFRKQTIGITGTKGKSTTAALLHHILQKAGKHALLAGNIGVPCFELLKDINQKSIIVYEMSSHQLEKLDMSPHTAVLLNVFMEHLDHYVSFNAYRDAKFNIAKWQQHGDYFLCNLKNRNIDELLHNTSLHSNMIGLGSLSDNGCGVIIDEQDIVCMVQGRELRFHGVCNERLLPGEHNLFNIAAAIGCAALFDLPEKPVLEAVADFPGLPHRLEYIGTFANVSYYNDSIATVPEATIEAIKALKGVFTLILGGYDRQVDYNDLMSYLSVSSVQLFLFIGEAGRRMHDLTAKYEGFSGKTCVLLNSLDEAVQKACLSTPEGRTVLLSPAASSYDAFENFKERGDRYKMFVKKYA